jgi:response regulator RpfG family c-di-GMP phosphodiesterase/ligand-binding sensor domain-containing protein
MALIVLLAAGSSALAAPPAGIDLPLDRFARRVWTTANGLPQNSVNAVVQTPDGYLWIGTYGGLARFDGARFEVFDPASRPPLASSRILSLLAAADGDLWIGTEADGLWREHRGAFARWRTTPELPARIWALARRADGTVWAATDDGAFAIHEREARRYGIAEGLPAAGVRAFAVDSRDRLWAATAAGAALLSGERFAGLGPRLSLWALTALPGGGVAAAFEDGALHSFDAPATHSATDELRVVGARTAIATRDGAVWIGGQALARLAGGRLRIAAPESGLVDGVIKSLLEDREGNLWLGLEGRGLLRLRAGRATMIGHEEGLRSESVLPIVQGRDGAMWIGGNCGGLWRVVDGDPDERLDPFHRPYGCVLALLATHDGALWVASDRGLDRLAADGGGRRFDATSHAVPNRIAAMAEDSRGAVWAVGEDGLVSIRGALASAAPRPPIADPRALRISRSGDLWVGGADGVAVLRAGSWIRYGAADGLPEAPVRDLLDDEQGALWLATYGGGLARLADGRARVFAGAQGLPDHFLSRLIDDGQGFLWITGNRGLFRVSWEDLRAVTQDRRAAVAPVVLGVEDGLRSSECNGGGQPAGWRARDGTLWIPTVRGAAVVDPRSLPARTEPPPVVIEEARIDGRPVGREGEVALSTSFERLELRYTALSFSAPESIRFRFRLAGHDTSWTDAGGSRVAVFRDLRPGRYRFEVAAADGSGVFGAAPATLAVRVVAPAWQTAWFQVLVALLLALAFVVAARYRTRQLRAREATLSGLVAMRTAELSAEKRRTETQLEELARKESELAHLNRDLGSRVSAQTAQIRVARDVAVLTLARLAELRDDETGKHLERIAAFSRRLAEAHAITGQDTLGLDFVEHLFRSSPLHDIGKVAIPDAILRKPGELTDEERRIMQSHTTIGGDTLRDVIERFESHSFLAMGMAIAYSHHERWDGRGYPRGLAGNDIPVAARIVAIADAYDAITSLRPYKPALSHEEAVERIARERGGHFDPTLVDRFLVVAGDFAELHRRLSAGP